MLWRLLNWVPVLFGLKMAGVATVATVQDVVVGEKAASVAALELTGIRDGSARKNERRTASGTIVTRLLASSNLTPTLNESFIFADDVVAGNATEATPATMVKSFVARPISVSPQRPVARLAAAKKARAAQVRYQPGQVKQGNRPAVRAKLRAEGRVAAKRVVWMASRSKNAAPASNVVAFPIPKKPVPTALRSAA